MTRQVIAGIGCRHNTPTEAILAMLDHACRTAGYRATAIAVPAFKAEEPGLRVAAEHLGLPLILIDAAALAAMQPRCGTRSVHALRATGFGSVAEASALAAAGAGGRLVLRRVAGGGVTCALAETVTE